MMLQQQVIRQPTPLLLPAICEPWQQVPLMSSATPSGQATVMLGQPAPGGGGGAALQLAATAGVHWTYASSGLGAGQLLSFRALPVRLLTHWTSLHGMHAWCDERLAGGSDAALCMVWTVQQGGPLRWCSSKCTGARWQGKEDPAGIQCDRSSDMQHAMLAHVWQCGDAACG
jgi:hypothetical protein